MLSSITSSVPLLLAIAYDQLTDAIDLIVEPHPDVLAYARSLGFYEMPGVRIYEGTWQQYLADLENGDEVLDGGFDAIYFDTYSG